MRIRSVAIALVAAAALVGVSCTAPTSTPQTWAEFCAPADWTEASFLATPLVVPAGAWLHANTRWDHFDGDAGEYDRYYYAEGGPTNTLVAGQTVGILAADAGNCIHVTWSAGLHFTVEALPSVLPGDSVGWPPGWDGGPI